jgi:hypothetical protein
MDTVQPGKPRRKQAGYALLFVVFMVATIIIAATAAAPSVLTEGRREKEAEMVWRGEQYERAIGLYYKKFGKYPTKVEDLTRQTNGVRFLRQAYTDPMNKDDGSWRFIYVGTNGQLIGSLHQTSLLQNALSSTGLGALTGGAGLQPLSAPGAATGANQAPGMNQTPGMNQATGIGQPGQQTNNATSANPLESQQQPLEGAVMGGNIIGIGSKIKKSSLRVYLGGDTYQQWEFIWNPTAQNAIPGQAPVSPNGIPSSAPNGLNPSGMNNGQPFQMNQQPQQNQQPPTINVPPPPSQ